MTTSLRYLLIMGIFSTLFSCVSDKKNKDNDLIEINSRVQDEFQDIVLSVVESELKNTEDYELIVKGKYNGQTVGLKIKIKDKLKAGLANGGMDGFDTTAVALNGVSFHSIGEESDNLIKILSKLYEYPSSKPFTKNEISFDMFSLNGEQADLSKGYFKFKLFFDPYDSLGLYSELFLNVNLPKNEVEINEKDFEYREAIVKAFTR